MSGLTAKMILQGNKMFEEFKSALTEQYVYQQLRVDSETDIFYWSADNATAELDFLVQKEDKIIPIEVKAEENLQAKSLRLFCEKYQPETALRTSMSNYREQEWMTNVPLYCIGEYMVAFNDLDIDEMIFISQTLKDLLVSASGMEKYYILR